MYTDYPNYWYVLFVLTGKEHEAERDLRRTFEKEEISPFLPTVEKYIKTSSGAHKENHLMFPGYVFVETELEGAVFRNRSSDVIRKSKHIMKLLANGSEDSMAVTDAERKALSELWQDERKIDVSEGFIEGDKVIIIAGPLKGHESDIKKIDRHHRTAIVEVELLGRACPLTVGLDIVRKV
jgi:transcriptional antiterminator NusG